mmetsp:Transcript_12888/g.32472  ORF Transcript_12888/g.32472 Transcript_12888/m.32472 type:complete len:215 (+) Transcript_12888:147-791(+)
MDSVTLYLFTPNKRKLSDERDDDVVVTPSSSFDESDCDDSPRETDTFLSTPCPTFESPLKRRRTSMPALHNSQLSPPLMPRLSYRPSNLATHQNERYTSGRPVLDIFECKSSEESNLSFLAIPTPPSAISDKDAIPTFGLSPRTTLAPRFPELVDAFPVFPDEKENLNLRKVLPVLRRRPINAPKRRLQLIQDLSLPTLAEVPERRSSLPAIAA